MRADMPFIDFRGEHEYTEGRVTESIETGASENDSSVYAVHYEYFANGERLNGISYSTGSAPDAGAMVTVEYDVEKPTKSVIDGLRRKMWGWGAIFVVIFPLIGLIGVRITLKMGAKKNRLLKHGLLAEGRLLDVEQTNMTVNDEPVMACVFTFTALDGREYETKIKTTDTKWLTDDDVEELLYDPDEPERALALDTLSPFPDFDESGQMTGRPLGALLRSLLPAITLAANWMLFQNWLG